MNGERIELHAARLGAIATEKERIASAEERTAAALERQAGAKRELSELASSNVKRMPPRSAARRRSA